MAAIQGSPMGHKISSSPVTGVNFKVVNAETEPESGEDFAKLPREPVHKSEVAAVAGALLVGALLVIAGAAVFGTIMVWGAKFIAGV